MQNGESLAPPPAESCLSPQQQERAGKTKAERRSVRFPEISPHAHPATMVAGNTGVISSCFSVFSLPSFGLAVKPPCLITSFVRRSPVHVITPPGLLTVLRPSSCLFGLPCSLRAVPHSSAVYAAFFPHSFFSLLFPSAAFENLNSVCP